MISKYAKQLQIALSECEAQLALAREGLAQIAGHRRTIHAPEYNWAEGMEKLAQQTLAKLGKENT